MGFVERLKLQRAKATKDWYAKMEEFKPLPNRSYTWVWEYAKFRLDWSLEKTRYIEEKGNGLLKLVLVIVGAMWVVFGGIVKSGEHVAPDTFALLSAGLFFLALGGYCALKASKPAEHIYPQSEDEAIDYASFYETETMALAKFSLQLGDSAEQERFLTSEKGHYVVRGLRWTLLGVAFFTLALLCEVGHRTGQFSSLRGLVQAL
jgi:hypothetical protein